MSEEYEEDIDEEEIDKNMQEYLDSPEIHVKSIDLEKFKKAKSKRVFKPADMGKLLSESCEKLNEYQKDEEAGVQMWKDLGIKSFTKEETKHLNRVKKAKKIKKCDLT